MVTKLAGFDTEIRVCSVCDLHKRPHLCALGKTGDNTQFVFSITLVRSWQETDFNQIVQINGLPMEGGVRMRERTRVV